MEVNHSRDELLSPLDAACLTIEDRTCLIVNAGAMIFAEPLDFSRLKDVLSRRFLSFQRFRQRVVAAHLPLGLPHWEVDPLFDLATHVHRIALPTPGDDQVLREVLSDLVSTPLDLSRPPWQVHLIENFGRGCVVLFRVHHCVADGMALQNVVRSITDRRASSDDAGCSADRMDSRKVVEPAEARHFADTAHAVLSETEALLHQAITLLFHPDQGRELAATASDAAATLVRLLTLASDSPSPFKGSLGVLKRVAWSNPIPVRRLRSIGRGTKATVNEVLLSVLSGALRRELERQGVTPCDLTFRVSVPVSMRRGDAVNRLGNQFSLNLLELPVDRGDPRERLAVLRERLKRLENSAETEVIHGLMNLFGLLPSEVANLALGLLNTKVTAVLSIVPGLPWPVHFAGQPVDRMMFWVPQSGRLGLGLSLLTYRGFATLGVACDAGLAPDPERLVEAFHDEIIGIGEDTLTTENTEINTNHL
jgi:WS/DGAT/MGAT family acyltransferase